MTKGVLNICCFSALLVASLLGTVELQKTPAEILQDARVHPLNDGTFGFLYKTQDGIAHGAKGDSNGVVQGRYTYTDETGFKFSSLYNAGLGVVKDLKAKSTDCSEMKPKLLGPTADSGQYDDRYHLDYENAVSKNRVHAQPTAAPAPVAPAPTPRYYQPAPQPHHNQPQQHQPVNYNYDYNVPVAKSVSKYPKYFEDDYDQTFNANDDDYYQPQPQAKAYQPQPQPQPQRQQQQQHHSLRYTNSANTYDYEQSYGGYQQTHQPRSQPLPRFEGPSVPQARSRPPALRARAYNNDYDY